MVCRSKCSNRKQLCTARGNNAHLSMVQISSTGQPEQATMPALVDTTERNLERDPNSPVKSADGSPLRQTKTLHSESPFQNLTDMSLLTPTRSYSRPKQCVAAICSAMSSMAQVKMCWKTSLKEIKNIKSDIYITSRQRRKKKRGKKSETTNRDSLFTPVKIAIAGLVVS